MTTPTLQGAIETILENLGIDTVGEDYIPDLPDDAAAAVRALHRQWNAVADDGQAGGRISADSWARWLAALPELRRHAGLWEKNLSKQEDLCSNLFRFCLSKL